MIFGIDFIKWLQFLVRVLQLLAEIFGDDDAKARAKELYDNHKSDFA